MIVSFMGWSACCWWRVGAGLMAASPVRPAQPMAEVASGTGDQRREQVLDLVAGQPDQRGRGRVAERT
jgi:hypothetical protein